MEVACKHCSGGVSSVILVVVVVGDQEVVGAAVDSVAVVVVLEAVASAEVVISEVVVPVAVGKSKRIHRFDFGFGVLDFGFCVLSRLSIVSASTHKTEFLMSNLRTRNPKSTFRNPKSNL